MSNNTAEKPRKFIDSLEFLFIDCWSNDTEAAPFCRINVTLGVLSSIILPIFIIGGFIGNSLTTYIYLKKLKPVTRQGVYFAAIAISDNCNLFMVGIMWMFLAKGLPWISGAKIGYFNVNTSEAACTIVRYVEPLFNVCSSILFLVMVIDRCLTVYFPFKFQTMSVKTSMKACLFAVLFSAALAAPYGSQFRWITWGDSTVCFFSLEGWKYTAFYTYVSLFVLPAAVEFFIILIANGFLIYKMREIVSEQAEIRAGSNSNKLTNTLICISLSAVLVVCSIPTVMANLTDMLLTITGVKVSQGLKKMLWGVVDIGRVLVLFNQSVNWIVLLWKSDQFRQAFIEIFRCGVGSANGEPSARRLEAAAATSGNN